MLARPTRPQFATELRLQLLDVKGTVVSEMNSRAPIPRWVTPSTGSSRPRGRAKRGTSALDAERKSEIVSRLYDLVSRRAADTQLTVDPERGRELPVEGVTHRGIGARLFISETTVPFTSKS